MRIVYIFTSSSQDCLPEREAVRDIAREFNSDPHFARFAQLKHDGQTPQWAEDFFRQVEQEGLASVLARATQRQG